MSLPVLNTVEPSVQAPDAAPEILNPLQRPDWDSLVSARSESRFFHGSAWARVLTDTYGHTPLYCCTISDEKLQSLLPIMEVSSPATGRRGVSLPFSDLCPPIGQPGQLTDALYARALKLGRERNWKYLECRDSNRWFTNASPQSRALQDLPSVSFYGHVVELAQPEADLLKNLDSAVRRGIRKAEAQGLRVEFSNTRDGMNTFYRLHCDTRKRHGLPPQPLRFFENIAKHVLAAGHGLVAIAKVGQVPVAAYVLFHAGQEAIYKFGASDYSYQQLRPNNLLMWEAMKHYAKAGFSRLHLGRTSLVNDGLRRFKLGFGAREETLSYRRYDFRKNAFITSADRAEGWANRFFRCMPLPALRLAGALLYPHLS